VEVGENTAHRESPKKRKGRLDNRKGNPERLKTKKVTHNVNETNRHMPSGLSEDHEKIFEKIGELYRELFQHDGYGTLSVEMRFLKKGQKEILVICGKEYRFVVNVKESTGS
jgi:hypothetical protein